MFGHFFLYEFPENGLHGTDIVYGCEIGYEVSYKGNLPLSLWAPFLANPFM